MKKLVWLHLSDVHFLPSNEWQDSTARSALLTILAEQINKHQWQIDLIFCTGDIAFGELLKQSLSAQYVLAQQFFDDLLKLCQCPRERLFMVPGNHDIDRQQITRAERKAWQDWGNDDESRAMLDEIAGWFAKNNADVQAAQRRLTEWGAFVAAYLPHQVLASEGHHHHAQVIEIDGKKIGIAGFNSAWTCVGDEDDRRLWLGCAPQFDHMRSQLASAELKIGLIHHPSDWFNVAEREVIKNRIMDEAHFWLHGHTHDAWVEPLPSHVQIGAGAITGHSEQEFGCNVVELDFASGKGRAHLFHYAKKRAKWRPDTSRFDDGIWPFDLPQALRQQLASTQVQHTLASLAAHNTPRLRSNCPLPARPICLARENELQRLVSSLLQSAPMPVILHGFGGMGKTEIASRFLSDDKTRKYFGKARYFLSVEGLENTSPADLPRSLQNEIARCLLGQSVAGDLYEALRSALATHAAPVLFVLDNYETIFQIDQQLANRTIEQLASLANDGLALLLTLREPLPNPRADCENITVLPFQDESACRSLLLRWANLQDTILMADEELALQQLLGLAEGYPIQLQMLGALAAQEGLLSLAQRCGDPVALANLAKEHQENDRHRHPNLSFALTWQAPRLSDAARSLLRALALLPDGVTMNWLAHWPDQVARRNVQSFKLLWPKTGKNDETRYTLLTPFRHFVLAHFKANKDDLLLLAAAWHAWLKQVAPELLDDKLPRKDGAYYQALHDAELLGLVASRRSGCLDYAGVSSALNAGLIKLSLYCGGVENWRDRADAMRQSVLSSKLFASASEAHEFANLLLSTVALPLAFKESVAEGIRQKSMSLSKINELKQFLMEKVADLAWICNSFDIVQQTMDLIHAGAINLHAPVAIILQDIAVCPDENIRLFLLTLTYKGEHLLENERLPVLAAFEQEMNAMQSSALAFVLKAEIGQSKAYVADLQAAINLAPDYAYAWSLLATAYPVEASEKAAAQAWQHLQQFVLEAQHRNFPVGINLLMEKYRLQRALEGAECAFAQLQELAKLPPDFFTTLEMRLEVFEGFCAAQYWQNASRWLGLAADKCVSVENAQRVEKAAQIILPHKPTATIACFLILFMRLESPSHLLAAAEVASQIDIAEWSLFFGKAANTFALSAMQKNDLSYSLLECADKHPPTLDFAAELAKAAFAENPECFCAETLLCAAMLHRPAITAGEIHQALQLLLTTNDQNADSQLACLYFDAKRYAGLPALGAWLQAQTNEVRNTLTAQALQAMLASGSVAGEVQELVEKLQAQLAKLESDLQEKIARRASLQDAHEKILAAVLPFLDDYPQFRAFLPPEP